MMRATIALVVVVACHARSPMSATEPPPDLDTVQVTALAENVWLHTSYKDLPDIGPFPSNGLIVKTGDGIVLVDTAWNDAQTDQLVRWTRTHLHAPIRFAIVTHAHDDKMGGMAALHRAGIETYAYALTNKTAPSRSLVPAKHDLAFADGTESLAGGEIEAFYPGAGHTADNIVVYIKRADVLFGGCLLRAEASPSLGNTEDADRGHWDAAVANVKTRYPHARIVVPSHSEPGGAKILDHTIALVHEWRAAAARE